MGDYLLVSDDRLTRKLTGINITLDTHITTSRASEVITDAEKEIANRLRSIDYSPIPATNSSDVDTFADKLSGIVAARCWIEVKFAEEAPFKVRYWLDEWKQFLSDLVKGNIELAGTPPATTQAGVIQVGGATFRSGNWTDADLEADDFYG